MGDKAQRVPSALLRGCQGRGGEEQGMQTEREKTNRFVVMTAHHADISPNTGLVSMGWPALDDKWAPNSPAVCTAEIHQCVKWKWAAGLERHLPSSGPEIPAPFRAWVHRPQPARATNVADHKCHPTTMLTARWLEAEAGPHPPARESLPRGCRHEHAPLCCAVFYALRVSNL